MPDIHGDYSLSEAAEAAGVTSAWINRLQRETTIGGELGKKGRKVSFNKKDVKIFFRIKVLRLIGFSFKEIKDIYFLEEGIMELYDELANKYDLLSISHKMVPMPVHIKEVIILSKDNFDSFDDEAKAALLDDASMSRYIGYLNELIIAVEIAYKRKDRYFKSIDDINAVFNDIFSKFKNRSKIIDTFSLIY